MLFMGGNNSLETMFGQTCKRKIKYQLLVTPCPHDRGVLFNLLLFGVAHPRESGLKSVILFAVFVLDIGT